MVGVIDTIKGWFRGAETVVGEEAEGLEPVATPPPGTSGDSDRETSTNAQTSGASDQPWPGNE